MSLVTSFIKNIIINSVINIPKHKNTNKLKLRSKLTDYSLNVITKGNAERGLSSPSIDCILK